jgi:hypothetical protein
VIRTLQRAGFTCMAVENKHIRATFLPAIGGKMIELSSIATGRQYLLDPQTAESGYRVPYYGAPFAAFDTSGFDECFPTIAPSTVDGIEFPDHGELWSRPWHASVNGEEAVLSIEGIKVPYEFEKKIQLINNKLILNYRLSNRASRPLPYLWSAHPLLKVSPGAQLLLPADVHRVLLHWASSDAVGAFGDILPWPHLRSDGQAVSYAEVHDVSLGQAVKCFTDILSKGFAGVYFPATDESLLLEFDPEENPYLGLWLCYGGWPSNGARKHLTVALEPCNGRPNGLADAMTRREAATLAPGDERRWILEMSVWKGKPQVPGVA